MRDKIRFEICAGCKEKAPHGFFFTGNNTRFAVPIVSLAAGHHLMNLLHHDFEEQQDELEMDIWQAGLPEKVEGDIEMINACLTLTSMVVSDEDLSLALLLLASISREEKGKKATDN